jgi:hypothetical protein
MGRPELELDTETILDLQELGLTTSQASKELGICRQTLSKRIADIQAKQGLLIQYRAIQSLQLTELQARCLEAITPEKIEGAPLKDLIIAFKILKDKELNIEGKPTEIKGLIHYLIQLEKEEAALAAPVTAEEHDIVEGITKDIMDPDYVPDWEDD